MFYFTLSDYLIDFLKGKFWLKTKSKNMNGTN